MSDNLDSAPINYRDAARGNLARAFWLLPLVFILHDAEELFTMSTWIADHRQELNRLAQMNETVAQIIRDLPSSTSQFAVSIGFILFLYVTVTVGVCRSQKRGFWLYAYSALLGVLFLHVFTHLGQAVIIGGYVPGLVGAVAAIIPGSLYIYKRLFGADLLTWKSTALTALIGFGLFIPGVLFAQRLGRIIISGGSP